MLAILVDRMIKDICSYSGDKSILEISVLNGSLYKHFEYELESIGIEKIKIINECDIEKEIEQVNDNLLLLYSNFYFEISTEKFSKMRFNKEFLIVDNDEAVVGLYCPKNLIKNISFGNGFGKDGYDKYNLVDYCCKIDNLKDYKTLIRDILDKKCCRSLPTIAEGVYAVTTIPKGDFVIVPPVFLDKDIQIEDGSVVGPYTVILNGSLIAKNSCIKNSFLAENSYVSSSCFVTDSMCFKNSSICRNSAVFSGCFIGHNAIINEDTFLENDSHIMPFMHVNSNDNYEENMYASNNSQALFYGLNPEKSALLGGALGNVFEEEKIAVLSDGENNSISLKLALIGGLMTTGAECFDFGNSFFSSIYYFLEYCQLDCGVYVSGKANGTAIYVVEKNKEFLSRGKRSLINSVMRDGTIRRCSEETCKSIRQIHGMQRMYIQHLIKNFNGDLNVFPEYICTNKRLKKVMEIATAKLKINSKKRIEFNINEQGSQATVKVDDKIFSHRDIIQIVSFFTNKSSILNYDELWRYDAVYLCFMLMNILSENNINIHEASEIVPSFYLAQKEIEIDEPLSRLLSKFNDNESIVFKDKEISFKTKNSDVNIKTEKNNRMKISVNSYSLEIAEEILGDVLKILGYFDH